MGINIEDPEKIPRYEEIKDKTLYGPNLFPSAEVLPLFRSTLEKAFEKVFELGMNILKAFELALNLPKDFFVSIFKGEIPPIVLLRLLRYPPQPDDAPPNLQGAGSHTDYGFITILYQVNVMGLEVQNSC
eukprot:TRINITY_DN5374_c0_g2_i1.p1 TRINITY_DN5374_c0_g2~~TRINITY_DN5374_c0_g2_i1.p1  ORF type:complete len:130 (-),score=32.06 TRINITY_DN5374_c0_g2_i1:3-392(-)